LILVSLWTIDKTVEYEGAKARVISTKNERLAEVASQTTNVVTPTASAQQEAKPTQFVLMSFDGSESIAMWESTLNFAKLLSQKSKPVSFTYFVSGVYFLNRAQSKSYMPPQNPVGTSKIGFSRSDSDIPKRVAEVNRALTEGHEIASHLNGHFNGSTWSEADWMSELNQYKDYVPYGKLSGIRTPLLARNESLYKVIAASGLRYDASGVGKINDWPVRNKYGTWEIPLVTIFVPGVNKNTLSMDYNIYLLQTGGNDLLKRDTPGWVAAKNNVVSAYLAYFNRNYEGSRAPVVIGHHFSAWNDGLYWEAMKSFAEDVCGKPEVKCGTFSQLVDYLERK
jgi:hypothetical protein